MIKMMKRLLCLCLTGLLLAGCAAPAPDPQDTQQTEPQVPGEVTVFLADTVCSADTWKAVCDAFTARTGIRVVEAEDAAQAQVIHLSGSDADAFLKTDPAEVLPALSAEAQSRALPGLLESPAASPAGSVQFLPLFCQGYGLGYNAALFEAKGWAVPTTWEEMWVLAETARAENISLFTYAAPAELEALFYAMLCSVGGPELMRKAVGYSEGVWTGENGKAFTQLMAKLAACTHPMTASQDAEQNLQLWLQGEALFFPVGPDTAQRIEALPKAEGFRLGVTAVMASQDSCYTYLRTERIWISERCENPAAAVLFLEFLYSETACDIFRAAGLTQPVAGSLPELFGDNTKAAAGSFAPYSAVATVGSPEQIFLEPFNRLVNGTITWSEWIGAAEDASAEIRQSLTN